MDIRRKSARIPDVENLRAQVDFAPYEPLTEAPGWMRYFGRIARDDLGTLALLGPAGVSIDVGDGTRTRLVPDPSSLYISALADSIRATDKKLAIGIPPLGRHLPLLIASTAVLANTLEQGRGSQRNGRVLIVSPDLDLRSRYCGVYVRKEMLDDAHPGSRMRPDGATLLLRPHVHETSQDRGVCFFLPNLDLPKRIDFTPSLVIVDLRFSRWVKRAQALASWISALQCAGGLLALYTLGDQDTAAAVAQSGFLNIPLDHAAVATCSQRVSLPGSRTHCSVEFTLAAAPALLDRRHVVEEIHGGDKVEDTYTQVARLLYEQRAITSPDLNRARWVLAALAQMPVPLSWYEQTARNGGRSTIKRLIETLGSRSRFAKDLGPVLQTVRMLLLQLHASIDAENRRAAALKGLLERIASNSETDRILVLVRDRMSEEALDSWLAIHAFPNTEWLERLDVRGCPQYFEIATRRYRRVVVNGSFSRRYQWISGAALGEEVVFLAYPHETDVIERQLRLTYDDRELQTRSHARCAAIAKLSAGADDQKNYERNLPVLILKRPAPRKADPDRPISMKSSRGLAGLAEALDAARRSAENVKAAQAFREGLVDLDSGDEEMSDVDATDSLDPNSTELAEVFRFSVQSRLHGMGVLFLRPESMVECVRPSAGEDVFRIEVQRIKAGDVILQTSGSTQRNTLFDKLVDLAEGQPELEYLGEFRRTWRAAIQKISGKFRADFGIDYAAAFSALKRAGAPIESEQAIKFWLQDQVIGPEAVASIEAVGQVSGSSALVGQAKHFDRAFRKIRGIHQGIGRRLSAVIRDSFQHLHFGHSERSTESLEDRLGIPLDELLENIELVEVIAVNPLRENVAVHLIGGIIPSGKAV